MKFPSFYLVIIIISLIYYLSYFRYGIGMLDEGFLVDPVMRVIQGEIPYKDFYHFYAPLSFYIFAFLFKIFSPSLIIVRLFWIIILITTALLIYSLSSRFMNKWYSICITLLFVVAPGPWHKSFFAFTTLLNLFMIFRYIESFTLKRVFLSGIITGISIFLRQDVGVFSFIVNITTIILLPLLIKRVRIKNYIILYIIGVFLIVIPILFYFYSKGALFDLLDQLLLAGYKGTSTNFIPFPKIFPLFNKEISFQGIIDLLQRFLHYIPPIIYILYTILIFKNIYFKKNNLKNFLFIPMVFMGILVFHQDLRRSEIQHLLEVLPICYILCGNLLFNKRYILNSSILLIIWFLILIFLIKIDHFEFTNSILARIGQDTLLKNDRAKVFVSKEKAKVLEALLDFISKNTSSEDKILAIPDIPLIYFLCEKTSPIKYELIRPGHIRNKLEEDKIISTIESLKVKFVIYNLIQETEGFEERRFDKYYKRLYKYFLKNYDLETSIGQYAILKRVSL